MASRESKAEHVSASKNTITGHIRQMRHFLEQPRSLLPNTKQVGEDIGNIIKIYKFVFVR